jgi:hypothetical protein
MPKIKRPYVEVTNVKAKALIFQSPLSNNHYVVLAEPLDTIEFMNGYVRPEFDAKQATGVETDAGYDTWFMCYLEDCYDPPIAIVNAEHEGDAIDAFVDKCEWARMSTETVEERENDGIGETVGWSACGYSYDEEIMQCRPIKLLRIEL